VPGIANRESDMATSNNQNLWLIVSRSLYMIDNAGRAVSSQLRPQSRSDILSWSRFEAGQYSLDWQASILYELEGLSHEVVSGTSCGSDRDVFSQVSMAVM